MQGARKYVEAIETLARAGGYGFEEFEDSIKFIRKGNFVFDCDYHARGKTLHIYLLKEMPSLDVDEKLLCEKVYNSKNALEVYGVISGQCGWTETYGYLVNNKIKHILSQILIDAVRNYNNLLNEKKANVSKQKTDEKIAYAEKVKDFEQFLLNCCNETTPSNAESESENEDENIITLDMITLGLKQGIIIPKAEGDGLKCYIGDYWFYFGGLEFEYTDPKDVPEDVLPTEIKIALDAFIETENREFETEYMYYYYYLLENLFEDERDTSDLISIDMVKKGIEAGVISQTKKDKKFVCLFENEYLFSLQDNGLDETEFVKKVYNFFIELCSSTGPEGDQYLYCFNTLKKLIEDCEEESDAE